MSNPSERPPATTLSLRRLRQDAHIRALTREVQVRPEQLIQPLFGVPLARSERLIDWSFTAGQISALKRRFGRDIWLAADVCLCSSTPHGHCGVLAAEGDHVDNDASVAELVQASLAYGQAGADCVAPSDMMDGRIAAIRKALDGAGLERTILMSYAVKFHSSLYGP